MLNSGDGSLKICLLWASMANQQRGAPTSSSLLATLLCQKRFLISHPSASNSCRRNKGSCLYVTGLQPAGLVYPIKTLKSVLTKVSLPPPSPTSTSLVPDARIPGSFLQPIATYKVYMAVTRYGRCGASTDLGE